MVLARKNHICTRCGGRIAAGEKYFRKSRFVRSSKNRFAGGKLDIEKVCGSCRAIQTLNCQAEVLKRRYPECTPDEIGLLLMSLFDRPVEFKANTGYRFREVTVTS